MSAKQPSHLRKRRPSRQATADVRPAAIRQYAREVAQLFHPDKIVLFGSHAYGKPHADSDVDILVVMPCRNQLDQAHRIRMAISPPFPMDLIVRKPANLEWRIREGESFHTEIMNKGKVLYEKGRSEMGRQRGRRLSSRPGSRPK